MGFRVRSRYLFINFFWISGTDFKFRIEYSFFTRVCIKSIDMNLSIINFV